MKMKPCPWCKKKVRMWDEEDPHYPGGPVIIDHYIECENCRIKMYGENEKTLIKYWNSLKRN